MSLPGVSIKSGLSDWQIVQQHDGKADLMLKGEWSWPSALREPSVVARVVDEETGMPVLPWTKLMTADGRFEGTLPRVPAGGLYRIETSLLNADLEDDFQWAGRGDMRHHVGVGDVYLIAGHSNAAGYAKDFSADPPELGVHLFRASGQWTLATHPLNDGTNSVFHENLELVNAGHSPFLIFAKRVKKAAGYPVGLVPGALGGSALSSWNPDEAGTLYRNALAMILAQGPGGIRGILWYQGCADATPSLCGSYFDRFTNVVHAFRRDLDQPELPFFTVQLNRWISRGLLPENDRAWGQLREAQRQAARRIPHVYIIPANDGRLSDFIHNSAAANLALGERLARQVARHFHGGKLPCFAPEIALARKQGENQLELSFSNVVGRLYLFEGDARFGGAQVSQRYNPFTVEDVEGVNPVTEWGSSAPDHIVLTTARAIADHAKVHGAFEANPAEYLPIDSVSQLPMLSFYGTEVLPPLCVIAPQTRPNSSSGPPLITRAAFP